MGVLKPAHIPTKWINENDKSFSRLFIKSVNYYKQSEYSPIFHAIMQVLDSELDKKQFAQYFTPPDHIVKRSRE